MFLFIIFFPRHDPTSGTEQSNTPAQTPDWRRAVVVVSFALLHFLLTFMVSVVMLARFPHLLQTWANILGIFGAVLASVQYMPQLWTTWSLGHVASLSIISLCIQAPGSFLFAASLAVRLGKSGWSAWIVYVVGGCLQACLLLMAATFETRNRRAEKVKVDVVGSNCLSTTNIEPDDEDSGGGRSAAATNWNETTPLIVSNASSGR